MSFGELALRRIPPIYTEGMDRELLPMLRLAGPVILAEIGWMSMGVVDTIMVGPLGPAAIGAAGMSNSLFFGVAEFGMGVMLGLDALVAANLENAFGKRVLLWGRFGLPALGVNGSAWASVGSRVYMAAFLGCATVGEHRKRGDAHTRTMFVFDAARVRRLLALGLPA